MKNKSKIFISAMLCAGMIFAGCTTPSQQIGTESEKENVCVEETESEKNVQENQKFLIEQIKIEKTAALGTAQILEECGCGQLQSVEDFEDDGTSYAMTLVDQNGDQFFITMGYDGYLGTVKDASGKYLYAPVD